MKKLSVFLIAALIFTTSLVYAEDSVPVVEEEETIEVTTTETEESTEEESTEEESSTSKGKGQLKKEVKAEWKVLKEEAKASFKEVMGQRKLIAKAQYTSEELKTFDTSYEKIKSNSKITKILGMGSISIKNNLIKFDTPPYIKGGRTVVPVKAITEGLGATVSFNAETYEVTIVKDDITIVLTIGSNIALVNGEEVVLDAKSEITNSRTYVPIKFIAETFGLTVKWDAETETIDIEEGTEEEASTENTTEETPEETPEETTEEITEETTEASTEATTEASTEASTEATTEESTQQ